MTIQDAIALAVCAVLAFTAAMCCWPAFNRAVARLAGARPGQSFSAYLWELETDNFGFAGDIAGLLLRPAVDALFLAIAGQRGHCRSAWLKDQAAINKATTTTEGPHA